MTLAAANRLRGRLSRDVGGYVVVTVVTVCTKGIIMIYLTAADAHLLGSAPPSPAGSMWFNFHVAHYCHTASAGRYMPFLSESSCPDTIVCVVSPVHIMAKARNRVALTADTLQNDLQPMNDTKNGVAWGKMNGTKNGSTYDIDSHTNL